MLRITWLLAFSSWFTGVVDAEQIVFENARTRAVLGTDAVWQSLVHRANGRELCAGKSRTACAAVRLDDGWHDANQIKRTGDCLVLSFAGCDTRLHYQVSSTDDWFVFRLERVTGTRPSHVTLLRIGVNVTERGGSRLNAAWNVENAVCLRTINLQSYGTFSRGSDQVLLAMNTQDTPGPPLEGSGAALIVSAPADLKPILARLADACDLPRNQPGGIASRDLPLARGSYWFLTFAERDVDRVIDYCQRTGIRQVMMNSSSWCASVGHFSFNQKQYPEGLESLRRTVARLHEHGILVGMHTFASKVSKHDPYVTPVPSRGFWVDMTARLAAKIGTDDTQIRTGDDLSQWPGSPVCRQKVWEGHVSKHQEVIIDDEIIRYESIGPEGRWDTFLGCQRGAWGTVPAGHEAAAECRHYGVDGCINGYILDQQSPLFDETTSRLAEVFNECDFDMVYFDGSEDVDRRRYQYFASNAHAVPMAKFRKRPVIHMGGGFTHGLWHSFTRSGTVDQYPGTYLAYLHAGGTIEKFPTCKDHIDRSVRGLLACEDEMTPGELGWFGIGPKSGEYDGLQFDEIEYLMCRSLAYDAPISLQTSFARMEAHPLTDDILEIVRQYEQLRRESSVDEAVRESLKQQGRDFVLVPAPLRDEGAKEKPVFAPVQPLEQVAGGTDVRALVGSWRDGSLVTYWHYTGKPATLSLPVAEAEVYDVRGNPVPVSCTDQRLSIPADHRRLLLYLPRRSEDAARRLFADAQLEIRSPTVLWLQAEDYVSRVGRMVRGTDVDVRESEALGDVVLGDGRIDRSGEEPSYCEYRFDIPHKGRWTLWARVRYPTGGDMSFGLVQPDERVTLDGNQVLGNCGVNQGGWHWTGRGGGVTTVPPGSPIVFPLEPGPFVVRIYPREGPGTRDGNPRLDCLCLAEDPDYRPTDEAAKRALERGR